MSDDLQLPASWAFYVPFLTDAVRKLMMGFGGAGLAWAQGVTDSDLTRYVSIFLMLVSFGWGQLQKYRAHQALSSAAAARANTSPPPLPA